MFLCIFQDDTPERLEDLWVGKPRFLQGGRFHINKYWFCLFLQICYYIYIILSVLFLGKFILIFFTVLW